MKSALFVDPDCVEAWFGHAIITLSDDFKTRDEVLNSFDQVMELGGGAIHEANYLFAKEFARSVETDATMLSVSIFSLRRYLDRISPEGQVPPRSTAKHFCCALNLVGLLQERQGVFEAASISFARCVTILESTVPGDEIVLRVKENLARVLCSMGSYAESIEYYEQVYTAGSVSAGLGQVGVGIAFFFAGAVSDGFKWFEQGLKSVTDAGEDASVDRVMIMIAQVLYALGSEQHRALAKQQFMSWYFICVVNILVLLKTNRIY